MTKSLITVLGLGNLIQSDDGLGVCALHRLGSDSRLPSGVRLVDGGTGGLTLLLEVSEAHRLLVLDAVDTGAAPGTVVRLTGSELAGLAGSAAVHQLGLADLLNAVRLLGREPADVVLLGVQPAELGLGTTLSPAVAAAVDPLVDAAIAQLSRWSQ
jgi:hydrogenase maturation protease